VDRSRARRHGSDLGVQLAPERDECAEDRRVDEVALYQTDLPTSYHTSDIVAQTVSA